MAKKKVNYREIFEDEDLALDNEAKRGVKSQIKLVKLDDTKLKSAHEKLCSVLGLKTPNNEMANFEYFKKFVTDEKRIWEEKEELKKLSSSDN